MPARAGIFAIMVALAPQIFHFESQAAELSAGIGAGYAPDYEGSDDYTFVPMPSFEFSHEGFTLKTSKLGLEADLLPMLGLDAGPILRYDMGRDDGIEDDVVGLLPEVDGSLELGGYLGAGLPLKLMGIDSDAILLGRISAVQGLGGGHEGAVIEASAGVLMPVNEQVTVIAMASSSYMSDNYADRFFGVTPAGSVASGLPVYVAGAGIKDVGASLVASYKWDEAWSTTLIGSYTRLVGDAADSPIVDQRGSADQVFVGVSLGYQFF